MWTAVNFKFIFKPKSEIIFICYASSSWGKSLNSRYTNPSFNICYIESIQNDHPVWFHEQLPSRPPQHVDLREQKSHWTVPRFSHIGSRRTTVKGSHIAQDTTHAKAPLRPPPLVTQTQVNPIHNHTRHIIFCPHILQTIKLLIVILVMDAALLK